MPIRVTAERAGDMHPDRSLRLNVQSDGDIVVCITQDGLPIGDVDAGNPEDRCAQVEFCVSGGRSSRTLVALRALIDAIKADNAMHPIR